MQKQTLKREREREGHSNIYIIPFKLSQTSKYLVWPSCWLLYFILSLHIFLVPVVAYYIMFSCPKSLLRDLYLVTNPQRTQHQYQWPYFVPWESLLMGNRIFQGRRPLQVGSNYCLNSLEQDSAVRPQFLKIYIYIWRTYVHAYAVAHTHAQTHTQILLRKICLDGTKGEVK